MNETGDAQERGHVEVCPAVTVVIPVHNAGRYLREAIASVLSQTFKDLECVVVDDGSTDDAREIVAEAAHDRRVRYQYQVQGGCASARNAGVRVARGRWLAFLDADDRWLPTKLDRQLTLLETRGDGFAAFCRMRLIDPAGTPLGVESTPSTLSECQARELQFGNVISGSASAVVVATETVRRLGYFDEALWAVEDLDMWRRLAEFGIRFLEVDETLVEIRIHPGSMQQNVDRLVAAERSYFAKLAREVRPEFRPLLPDVAYGFQLRWIKAYLRTGQLLRGLGILATASDCGRWARCRIASNLLQVALRRLRERRAEVGRILY